MPASTIASAIVSSIITAIIEAPTAPVEPVPAAMMRMFPEGTALGTLGGPPEMGQAVIDGQVLLASPGLQVRDEMNMIVFPSMVGHEVPVRYQLDPFGNVWRIWLLSPAEVAAFNSR